jgi:hypothetical protein
MQSALFAETAGKPAAQPTTTTVVLHVEVVTLPLPGGLGLRLARVGDELVVATGFMDTDALRGIASGLRIPLEMWLQVRAELDRLAGLS